MMHREVSAIVLCILAQAAAAECATTPAVTAQVTPVVAENVYQAGTAQAAPAVYNARTAQAMPAAPAAARKGELIKAAAAGTRDDAPPSASSSRDSMSAHADEDHPRRGGTAMLLAALALMSGIALRRYGARDS